MQRFDVIILGGGLAGGLLARHLKRVRADLSVLVLEQSEALTDYKVGESTVEVAADYLVRRLGLGTYLYQHQLPKNGLRFFFDSPDKDLPLWRMSEIGADHFPYYPSFQLERASFERDLAAMNRSLGVAVELGAKVVGIDLARGGKEGGAAPAHEVSYERSGARERASARFLCDASGRRHLLARALGQRVHKETRLDTGAAWGRFRGVAGLDAVEEPAWRARVRHTSRHLSTNHLMYDGYWIWFIPLAGDVMSVGVVYDRDRIGEGPRTAEEMLAFLRRHRAARDLLEGSSALDFQQYAHLPYRAERFFSEERWGMTGFAGAFTDPFYSPGSDFIALANEMLVSLVLADLAGDEAALRERAALFDAYYAHRYETTLRLYEKLYPTFGCFSVFRLKYLLDFNNYYNQVFWPHRNDLCTDLGFLRDELRAAGLALDAQSRMASHFAALAEDLRARGAYHAENEGRWANGLDGVAHLEGQLDGPLDAVVRRTRVNEVYARVFASLLERTTGISGLAERRRVLDMLPLTQVIAQTDTSPKTLSGLLDRIGARMRRDLGRELPDISIDGVRFALDAGAPPRVLVSGPSEGSPEHARALARATELWDATVAARQRA